MSLYDRIFRPRRYTLSDGTVVEEKRSRAPLVILILVVLFQSGKSQGLSGAIGGIADSYMAKSKAKSLDAKLAKGTKWVGAVFIILTLVINCMLAAGIGA